MKTKWSWWVVSDGSTKRDYSTTIWLTKKDAMDYYRGIFKPLQRFYKVIRVVKK